MTPSSFWTLHRDRRPNWCCWVWCRYRYVVTIVLANYVVIIPLQSLLQQQPWSNLHAAVAVKLLSIFLMGNPSSSFVLARAWQLNSQVIINAMVLLHSKDPNALSRILDVAQELKVGQFVASVSASFPSTSDPLTRTQQALNVILENNSFPLVIDLAALAARREYLNLEKWLQDATNNYGDEFLRALMEFINIKLIQMKQAANEAGHHQSSSIPLSERCILQMTKALQNNMR